MRVVLHIGLPKTGSTSIQSALAKSRSRLAKEGILYPRIEMHDNHNLLSLPFKKRLPRTLGKRSEQARSREITRANNRWQRLTQQIAKEKPHAVVLSSEYFAFIPEPDELITTVEETIPQASKIEVIAYLRRPSQHYVSLTQQKLKASSKLPRPKRIRYAEVLAPFAARCELTLREMHPKRLVDGDVVVDFATVVLPEQVGLIRARGSRKNVTVSAEGMALLQEFRRNAFAGQDHRFNAETVRLLHAIRRVEAAHEATSPFTRPRLHPNWERFIDYATDDNEKLRERFGFRFFDLDDEPGEALDVKGIERRDVSDVLAVDQEKLELLRSLVLKDLAERKWDAIGLALKLSRWRRI